MRPSVVLLALAFACPALPVLAQNDTPDSQQSTFRITRMTVNQVIRLRFISPEVAAARLRGQKPDKKDDPYTVATLPAGIDKLTLDPRTNSLLVQGTPEAVTQLKKTVSSIDVETTGIRIQMKVLRFDFDADGTWDVKTIGSPTIVTLDNSPATISVNGDDDAYSVDITSHKNADGTISVKGDLRAAADHAAFRRETPGRAGGIVAGVSNSHSAAVRKAAASGRIPSVKGEAYTVYYLQIVSVK